MNRQDAKDAKEEKEDYRGYRSGFVMNRFKNLQKQILLLMLKIP